MSFKINNSVQYMLLQNDPGAVVVFLLSNSQFLGCIEKCLTKFMLPRMKLVKT